MQVKCVDNRLMENLLEVDKVYEAIDCDLETDEPAIMIEIESGLKLICCSFRFVTLQ